MRRTWSRIFALALGIPLLLGILAACGAGTTTTSTPTGSTTIKIATQLWEGCN
jgi:branched-chain amino acid transport system substrate-binding protein